MTNKQRAVLDACNRFKDFNTKNATAIATITEYAAEQLAFSTALTTINAALLVQSATEGTTVDAVNNAKIKMGSTVTKYALRATVKAKQIGNITLANNLDHQVTYITQAPKNVAVQRAKDIRKHINDNLATLTNIVAANITEIDAAITAYDNIKDSPTIDIQTREAAGTNPLPAALKAATQAMDNMHNLVVSYFLDTNKTMADSSTLAKAIIVTGIHHSGVSGTVTKSGHPVLGATVSVVGTDKKTTTDKDGHYSIAKVKTGDFSIKATTPDDVEQTKTVHISQGSFETLDFDF